MSAVPEYSELHHLVDQLTPDQARALRAVAVQLVRNDPVSESSDRGPAEREGSTVPTQRRLSFAGIGHAGPDLAEASEQIMRAELGDTDR
jgi:hypothetical protein